MSNHTPGPCICGFGFNPHTQACIANAKLIAAAPDMAEALRAIMLKTADVGTDASVYMLAFFALSKAGL